MTRTLPAVLILAFIVTMISFPAQADPRDEAMRRIEMLRIWRLTELLDLNPEDAAKIFPVLSKYDKLFREKGDTKDNLLKQMRLELKKEKINSVKLEKINTDIFNIERDAMNIREQMFEELSQILTPEQLAKYILFEIKFQLEIEEIINKIRRESSRIRGIKIKDSGASDK